ncbi:MAG: hypothetical protein LH606_02735 [Cytophagaceae bacterium]|nr:hypothetical protein [Cytophagaceae bacterium]
MKTNFKALALAAAVFTTSLIAPLAVRADEPATAQNQPTSFAVNAFRAINPLKLRVMISKKDHAVLQVALKDGDGTTLFEEVMWKNEMCKALSLDLSALPDGQYTVEVSSKTEKFTKTFDLSTPSRTLAMK